MKSISKKYRINHEHQPNISIRDSIGNLFTSKSGKEDFWALKDVCLEVMPGDTVGIIGKNGAGKSTLLKILSKITPPTSGKIIGRGRIASLLEVGTGFHPELTGRENIFMNGSILGMKRSEIKKNFDAIVDFSGVERFLDTPLKHYSSGMQLRLAFAVAAFLENEILIIDEVLAVGDAEFQKKCLGKMEEVSKDGRTVLFVSHNLGSLRTLCKKGVVLNKGEVKFEGTSNEAVEFYLSSNNNVFDTEVSLKEHNKKGVIASAYQVRIYNPRNKETNNFYAGDQLSIDVDVELSQDIPGFIVGLGITSDEGAVVRTVWSKPETTKKGKYKYEFNEKDLYYGAGRYNISLGLSSNEVNIQYFSNCLSFLIEKSENKELSLRSDCGFVLNQMEVNVSRTNV
ncbi:MAG: ABC transporter ATP-binding protein [Bacteroidia bacterium]